ncbi:MAG: serine protease [Pedobacter sp.]|nr:MAG: serine protease [Pedobacter sp.]
MKLTTAQIAEALKTNRKEFSTMFLQAQSILPLETRFEFEAIAIDTADDRTAFDKALRHAAKRNFLSALLSIIVRSALESGEIARMLMEQDDSMPESTLQSIVNAGGFTEPHTYYRGIAQGMKWTGKVIINGKASGSGILIGANLFLTAWHVVESLFHPGTRDPITDIDANIEFDNFLYIKRNVYGQNKIETIPLAANWYVIHSRCHDDELDPLAALTPDLFHGFWDYVVLRLERPLGFDRGWARLDSRAVIPQENEKILLFQHPAGQSMRIDQNIITSLRPAHNAIPKDRFLHMANATHGSSGGPCFDKEFYLVGIHQGSWPEQLTKEKGKIETLLSRNRGIPITNIIRHIKETVINLPLPSAEESPCYWLDERNYEPVIGCDDFQLLIWSLVLRSEKRIVNIFGAPFSGKSFLVTLTETLLANERHLKIQLPAEQISKTDVLGIIELIARKAGIDSPNIIPLKDFDNTASAWLKNHILPELINALDGVRNGRLVWLMFPEMNRFDLEGPQTSDFLLLMLEGIRPYEWLRIVLDGAKQPLPFSAGVFVADYRSRIITKKEIEEYLKRIVIKLNLDIDTQFTAGMINKRYERYLKEKPEAALSELRIMVMDALDTIL